MRNTATAQKVIFCLGQSPQNMQLPHKWWLCRGYGYPRPAPGVECLKLCLLGGTQEKRPVWSLVCTLFPLIPFQRNLLSCWKALPPGIQHRPLVGVPLHTCFQIASLPKRSASPLLLCRKRRALTAALHVSVICRKDGLTEHRSLYLGHTTSLW